jgi:hypothetical protein
MGPCFRRDDDGVFEFQTAKKSAESGIVETVIASEAKQSILLAA